MNSTFLEKRKKALNAYLQVSTVAVRKKVDLGDLQTLLHADVLASEAAPIIVDFCTQPEFTADAGHLSKRVQSLVAPLKAISDAVTAVPDNISKGMNRLSKSVIGAGVLTGDKRKRYITAAGVQHGNSLLLGTDTGSNTDTESSVRVSATFDNEDDQNIPLRIIMLLVDEVQCQVIQDSVQHCAQVFELRGRNQFLRRQLVAVVRQLIHTTFGASINRKIVDCVTWLTSEEQVAEYLRLLKPVFGSFVTQQQLAQRRNMVRGDDIARRARSTRVEDGRQSKNDRRASR